MGTFLVSAADILCFDVNSDALVYRGTTLLDSSLTVALENVDIRGGQGNQLQYIYYHSADLTIEATEVQFSLPFLAMNVGSQISTGENHYRSDTIALDSSGSGTLLQSAVAVATAQPQAWITLPDNTMVQVPVTGGNTVTVPGITEATTVCAMYYTFGAAARGITIYADLVPGIYRVVLQAQLASSDAGEGIIGEVQIEIPRAQMTGNFTYSMTADGVSQTPLSMRALAYLPESTGGCVANRKVLGFIKEIKTDADPFANVIAFAVDGGDQIIPSGSTEHVYLMAIPSSGSPFRIFNPYANSALSIIVESGSASIAPDPTSGAMLITGGASTSTIKVVLVDRPTIDMTFTVSPS